MKHGVSSLLTPSVSRYGAVAVVLFGCHSDASRLPELPSIADTAAGSEDAGERDSGAPYSGERDGRGGADGRDASPPGDAGFRPGTAEAAPGLPPTTTWDSGSGQPEVTLPLLDAGGFPPPRECPPGVLAGRYEWEPVDWSSLSPADAPDDLKVFPDLHPSCEFSPAACEVAAGDLLMGVTVRVYLDSTIWTAPEQLTTYLELVNRYFAQAALRFDFDFRPLDEMPELHEDIDQLTLILARALPSPSGEPTEAYGHLPSGKAVVNDTVMLRPHSNENPYFVPGKTIGTMLGLVLGASFVEGPEELLMAKGTGPSNGLEILPAQALIMRVSAFARFGGSVEAPHVCL